MDTGGVLLSDFLNGNIRYNGNNQIVSVMIKNGTRIVSGDGSPVDTISVQAANNVPPAPTGQTIVSALEFGPTGATFSYPMSVVFAYDPTQVPHNIAATALSLEYYNTQTNTWTKTDYTVDIENHQITANLSHFSLYAVMISSNTGIMGIGWSMTGTIIILELLLGGLVIYYFMRRKRPSDAKEAQSVQSRFTPDAEVTNTTHIIDANRTPTISWDELLPRNIKKGEPFKTNLEIIGGKIVIPTGPDSVGIELVNNPDSRILVSLEYDPELQPHGLAKIMVLGSIGSAEYQKSKGE